MWKQTTVPVACLSPALLQDGRRRDIAPGRCFSYQSQEWITRILFASAAVYAAANDNFGHHLDYLLSCSRERGCAGVNGHLHGYVEQEEWLRMEFSQFLLHFCMAIAKGRAISTAYGVCLEGHIPKHSLTVFVQTQFWLFVHWSCKLWIGEDLGRLHLQLCYFIPQDRAKMFPSVYVWESVYSGYQSAAEYGAHIQRLNLA